jgi:hypothetical protein
MIRSLIQGSRLLFFERTYESDPAITKLFLRLRKLIDEDVAIKNETDLDGIYTSLMMRLLFIHRNLRHEIDKLSSLKNLHDPSCIAGFMSPVITWMRMR